jgi:hypothetical protein
MAAGSCGMNLVKQLRVSSNKTGLPSVLIGQPGTRRGLRDRPRELQLLLSPLCRSELFFEEGRSSCFHKILSAVSSGQT